jgi:hypothetical protein
MGRRLPAACRLIEDRQDLQDEEKQFDCGKGEDQNTCPRVHGIGLPHRKEGPCDRIEAPENGEVDLQARERPNHDHGTHQVSQ